MGIATILTTAVGAISQVAGGIFAASEASRQQRAAEEAAAAAAEQSRLEAEDQARAAEREAKKLKARQLVGFLKSGVQLEGTPLQVLEETERLGEEDLAALRRRSEAQQRQFLLQGQARGAAAAATGRARLFSGIGSGLSTIAGGIFG